MQDDATTCPECRPSREDREADGSPTDDTQREILPTFPLSSSPPKLRPTRCANIFFEEERHVPATAPRATDQPTRRQVSTMNRERTTRSMR